MIQLPIKSQNGITILNIPEFEGLSSCVNNYRHHKTWCKRRKYYKAFHAFLRFYISYANSLIANTPFTEEERIREIFVAPTSKDRELLAYVEALKEYAEFLDDAFNSVGMMHNADDVVFMMLSDCELVLRGVEQVFNNRSITGCYWTRGEINLRDITWAMSQLFTLPQSVSRSYIDVRNIQPLTIFMIRQFIETCVKRALGIIDIEKSGKPAIGLTTPMLKFFFNTTLHNGFTIQCPVASDCILAIEKWTNKYIHTAIQSQYYIVYNAWMYVNQLIMPASTPVQIFTGRYSQSLLHGDIRITNYNTLKAEFENYINPNGKYTIKWMSPENAGSYVISL